MNDPRALAWLRVVDLTTGAAAFAGRLLADFGADVVKIETAGGEIGSRTPPFLDGPGSPSLFYWHYNLGKRLCILDPADASLDALLDLADIVIDGGPEAPFGRGPRLDGRPQVIWGTIAGFGRGPRETWLATELIAQAAGGMMYAIGEPDRPPLRAYGEQAHHLASHHLVSGILLALRSRRSSGRGQSIEVTLQESVASAIDMFGVAYNYENRVMRRAGDLHWNRAWGNFPCLDGFVALSWQSSEHNWEDLVGLLVDDGAVADLAEPMYRNPASREQFIPHIRDVLGAWAATRTTKEIFEKGQAYRMNWAIVYRPSEVLEDPHLADRQFFRTLPAFSGRSFPVAGPPARLLVTPWFPRCGAPEPSSSTEDVFSLLEAWSKNSGDQPSPATHVLESRVEPRLAANSLHGIRDGSANYNSKYARHLPLEGIRVLDFTWVLAGPFCTRLLADYGADVIKVQTGTRPRKVDGYYITFNRSKRGISLNMEHPEARTIAGRLAALSDLVVDNFSARVMRKWGLDDESLMALRKDLIVAHLSGMGHSGPYASYRSVALTAQALSGLTYLTSYPGMRPTGIGVSFSDHVAGLTLANAVLAAFEYRSGTGKGQVIDCSMFESTTALLGTAFLEAALGRSPDPSNGSSQGVGHPSSVGPSGVFACQGYDRWLAVEVTSRDARHALLSLLGLDGASSERLEAALSNWVASKDAETAARKLQSVGVAASVVATAADLIDYDEGLKFRGFWTEVDHPVLGRNRFDGPVACLSETPARPPAPTPVLDEDNEYVYGDILGLSRREFNRLVDSGVLV